jgi:multidrug efflux pump subunit AcrB
MAEGPRKWEELEKLFVINANGKPVSIWNLTDPVMEQAQGAITHKAGRRSVTVLAKLDGAYVSEVIERMRPVIDDMKQSWPEGYDYMFAGEKETSQEVYGTMLKVFVVAMILVYAILALLFDSLFQPVIILSTVLFALTGVFFGFFLTGQPFSFAAAIGVVALVGIVVNDALIVVDTMNNHLRSGLSTTEAAMRGASDRLRPIISTTVTNLAGLAPLAMADPGWAPLCLAIIYGEIVATIGALVLVPAIYMAITPTRKRAVV